MNIPATAQLYRSSLIVPLSEKRFVERASTRGADSITLDLEDGVADREKESARAWLGEGVLLAGQGGARIEIRVNHPLGLMVRDIEAAVIPGVSGLRLPKVESAAEVRRVSEFVGELEREKGLPEGGIQLQALIETPKGILHAAQIASADQRLTSIGLGGIDFAAACGFEPTIENLTSPSQSILVAARAAGIRARGLVGSFSNFSDLEGFRRMVRHSRQMGFCEGGAIHPAQVTILNEEMGPTEVELAQARQIVALAEKSFAEGRGAFSYQGRMIDRPIVTAAQNTLAIGTAIEHHRRLYANQGHG